jgi:hypothetical protein
MTLQPDNNTDWYTVAAIALTAMCLVTFDHEALGHGGLCLAIGGRIEVLTSSIFRCNVRSIWIDPAGPLANLLAGSLSLLIANWIPRRHIAVRLFLTLIATFSLFWESGYLIKAMLGRNGDLYFAAEVLLGEPSLWWRIMGTGAGIILYVITARWVSRALTGLFPHEGLARRAAQVAWVAASLGAALAALLHGGRGWAGFRDAVLEISAASVPLLFIARMSHVSAVASSPAPIRRNWKVMCLSLAIYAVFVATLGRGLYF